MHVFVLCLNYTIVTLRFKDNINHEERDFAEFLFKSLDKNQKIEICKFSQTWMLQELKEEQSHN
ncbi:hypothetical protein ABB41_10000 [Lactococcus lactis]|nr:hypothetical protein ABB41_10000 [Lactococcus lactis]